MTRLRRLLLAGTAVSAGLLTALGAAPQAGAVQTDTYSLSAVPGPDGAVRSALSGTGSKTTTDTLEVTDRGTGPVTLDLYVISAQKDGTQYKLGGPVTGLASKVRLGQSKVALVPGQSVKVPVTIGAAPGPTSYAAVLAKPDTSIAAGGLQVTEQLALLVRSDGGTQVGGNLIPGIGGTWPAVAAGALALVAAGAVVEQRRGRRASDARRVGAVA